MSVTTGYLTIKYQGNFNH